MITLDVSCRRKLLWHQMPQPPEMSPGCQSCTHPSPPPGRVSGCVFALAHLVPGAASDPRAGALQVSLELAKGSGTQPAGASGSTGRWRGQLLAGELPHSGGLEGEATEQAGGMLLWVCGVWEAQCGATGLYWCALGHNPTH